MTTRPIKRKHPAPVQEAAKAEKSRWLVIEGLRQNNLKNLSLSIPHDRITAIVGPSGSGKSSLAFDALFAEGRRRFMESLSTYTRLFLERMDRPDVDVMANIRPAIAVEQKNTVRTSRSTVGTATEINDYLRLLFARVGKAHCPECLLPITASSPQTVADSLLGAHPNAPVLIGFTIPIGRQDPNDLCSSLVQKGFIRVKLGNAVVNISEQTPDNLPDSLDVIADRLSMTTKDLSRLASSLETAFKHGNGDCWAEITMPDGSKIIERFSTLLKCVRCGVIAEAPTPISLSFNHPIGACPACKGFGHLLTYDEDKIIPNKNLSLRNGAITPWTKPAYTGWYKELERHAAGCGIDLDKPFSCLTHREKELVFNGADGFNGLNGFFAYLEAKKYKLHIKVFSSRYKGQFLCNECNGARLKKSALNVKVADNDIATISRMSIKECLNFFKNLPLTPFERKKAHELIRQITLKLDFLNETGLGFITLDRPTKTLSGGEAQRVNIATQLASSLTGVLYILDEPSIGLHPIDTDMLIRQLRRLSDAGNTVVVVEHDQTVIRSSDYVVELGPGAGERGGKLIYSGDTVDFLKHAATLTSDYLTGKKAIHVPRWRRGGNKRFITLKGAEGFNLKGIDVRFPLRTLICVSGASGSGKSALVVDTLYKIMASRLGVSGNTERPLPHKSLEGLEHVSAVKLIDQGPLGRSRRSNPITYIGGFDAIRAIYASLPTAKAAGLDAGSFSFNVAGGRCESCKGEGTTFLEMYFLPDVYIKCADCSGRRFRPEALKVKYKGRSIYDCLQMTFDDAASVFSEEYCLRQKISVLREIGLGYLKLGQTALTLSGGEAQRIKVAGELIEGVSEDAFYIMDEPTTGLHPDDVKKLLSMLGRLVDAGNTALLIEHNLDCLKSADHIIDLGPGAGEAGGRVIASGTPEQVAASKESLTARFLREALEE
ncbi:MAG: excinuclease ABC subunit UvrA [Deltaproteobacteria bacterium]|nr:excinuclease ABC subunit UvrA [Deltaproteobacteria bacterium]